MGAVVSSSHAVSATPCPSGGGLCTLFPCSCMRSLPQETVLHELLQHGSFPRGAVLQEQAAPVWVPHGVTSPASNPAPVWAPLSTGLQVLPGASFSTGSPVSQLPSDIHLLHCGSPWAAGGQPASPLSAPQAAGESDLAPGASTTPPFLLTWVSAELFLSHRLTPLSGCCPQARFFFPFLNTLPKRH